MRTVQTLLALLTTVILAGCSTPPPRCNFNRGPATEITVSVTCSDPGMSFTGVIFSDGHTEQLFGTGGGTFHASGHEFVCSFQKTGDDGRIGLAVTGPGKNFGASETDGKRGGVRAEVLCVPWEQHGIFSTF